MSGLHTPQPTDISEQRPRPPARLRKRAGFVAAARGLRLHTSDFSLQALKRTPADEAEARFGLTVTKKEGNAVVRNRLRRRLREALRVTQGLSGKPGHDYVIVARRDSLKSRFSDLQSRLLRGLEKLLAGKPTGAFGQRKPKQNLAQSTLQRPLQKSRPETP